jgi:hypothetical protein
MKTPNRVQTSRRNFIAGVASSTAVIALGQPGSALAGTVPSAPLLPGNFANPPGSPIDALLKDIPMPRLVAVETRFDRPVLADVEATAREKLRSSGVLGAIRPGMAVAVGAGSRGITDAARVTKVVLAELQRAGAKPFIFPAMGSHGGATPEGQRAVLARMGFTEESMGVPIRCTMDVVQVGTTPTGLPAYIDAYAAAADGIIVVNRVKPHTTFRGKVESGLVKMIVIGAGKQKGAETCHQLGYPRMEENLLALCRVSLAKGRFLFGVGLIENAYHETCRVEVVPATEIIAREPVLLAEARKLMPRVPIAQLDVLVIDEVGKDISGTGFDPNVVGRYPTADVPLTPEDPRITRISILDITSVSDGNGTGVGIADFTTEKVFRKFSFIDTYCNLLTSTTAAAGKIPMVMRNDRQTIQAAIKTSLIGDMRQVRLARIKNTLSLDRMLISENLVGEARADPRMTTSGRPVAMAFDGDGNLA